MLMYMAPFINYFVDTPLNSAYNEVRYLRSYIKMIFFCLEKYYL